VDVRQVCDVTGFRVETAKMAKEPAGVGATIRDVAARSGVSIATVSRVLRGTAAVTPATRHRVEDAIAELQFRPSRLGRSLAERRHAANGIVFPDLSGPYYAEVVLGYEAVAADLGRSVLILSTHGREGAARMVEEIADRCDGLVIMGRTVDDDVVARLATRLPVVLLARFEVGGVDSVKAENTASADALLTHVLERGARRVLLVGDPGLSPDVAERWLGFERAAGRWPDPVRLDRALVRHFDEKNGAETARAALEGDLPDAVLCANDELALGVLAELRDHGVEVPGRVAVTGWDDIMAARYAGLTTVRQPMRELGSTAARLLDEVLSGTRTTPRHEVLPTELVVRASTEIPKGVTST
jgi:LacI family transcriptional regulator